MDKYDLAVLGAGPAGHFGAIQAAKNGKRVVMIEEQRRLGGNSTNTGTIPSKSLREATLHLTGLRQQHFSGASSRSHEIESLADLTMSAHQIVMKNTRVFEDQLRRNGVTLLRGHGAFVAPNRLVVERGCSVNVIEAERTLIAVGSSPVRPPGIDFDGQFVVDSNQILSLERIPDRLIVVGGGVIGIEYACIFAAIGCHVTLIHDRDTMLDFCDRQIVDVLRFQMMSSGVCFRLNESVVDLSRCGDHMVARTESNKTIIGDCVLFCGGRQGNTDSINVEAAGLQADSRGRIKVDENLQTEVPGIYAAGDVIGFPALAATSREQGRRAACHAFDIDAGAHSPTLPYGVYAIPELSMFGPTEEELTRDQIPYELGIAKYREIARGQILGDTDGMLKILFDPESHEIHSVHIVGEGATELIHIGLAVKAHQGTLDYFASAVFNYPTLAECYKVAALDGLNRARLVKACGTAAVNPAGSEQEEQDRAAEPESELA